MRSHYNRESRDQFNLKYIREKFTTDIEWIIFHEYYYYYYCDIVLAYHYVNVTQYNSEL